MALRLLDRGLALKDEAYESGPLSLLEDAVAAYAELEERFGRLRGAPFEEIVAVAVGMYNKAGTLESLGRTRRQQPASETWPLVTATVPIASSAKSGSSPSSGSG